MSSKNGIKDNNKNLNTKITSKETSLWDYIIDSDLRRVFRLINNCAYVNNSIGNYIFKFHHDSCISMSPLILISSDIEEYNLWFGKSMNKFFRE